MYRLRTKDRVRIVACLVEGMSVRSTCRITGFAKGTVLKFLLDMGDVCEEYHDRHVRGLQAERIQADEIWSFCYCKDKNVPDSMRGQPGVGDAWTWTALDKDSKLMVSWYIGGRDADAAGRFMLDLSRRLANRVQLTTDGYRAYERVVEEAFGWNVDYAMLVKLYGQPEDPDTRFSPARCIGSHKVRVIGWAIEEDISTSHVERQNLTMRMGMRRFTRLTNAFSKKLANLRAAVALHFMHYNYCRVHQSLRVTPAMEAGLAKHVWGLDELVDLLEARERALIGTPANRRGPYQTKAKDSD